MDGNWLSEKRQVMFSTTELEGRKYFAINDCDVRGNFASI
jgi:hypothetical protein